MMAGAAFDCAYDASDFWGWLLIARGWLLGTSVMNKNEENRIKPGKLLIKHRLRQDYVREYEQNMIKTSSQADYVQSQM